MSYLCTCNHISINTNKYSIIGTSKLVKKATNTNHVITWSLMFSGKTVLRILKRHARPMHRSTWILSLVIRQVLSTSGPGICLFTPRCGGTLTKIPLVATSSWISNPLSALIISPLSSRSMRPNCVVSFLPEILPLHASDTKDTKPEGVQPINTLNVLRLL